MHFTNEEKAMWIEDWKRSGKKPYTYAKDNGIVPQAFARWTKSETEAKPCFVEITTQLVQPSTQVPKILIEKGEIKIHIPLVMGLEELRIVMEGLGAVL